MSEDCEVMREKKIMVRVAKRALRTERTEGWVGRFLTTNLSLYCRSFFRSLFSSSFSFFFFFFCLTHIHQSCCGIDGIDTRKTLRCINLSSLVYTAMLQSDLI